MTHAWFFQSTQKKGNLPNCVLGTYNVYIYICTPIGVRSLYSIVQTRLNASFIWPIEIHLFYAAFGWVLHAVANTSYRLQTWAIKWSSKIEHVMYTYIYINIFNRIITVPKKSYEQANKWVGSWNQNTLKKICKHWQILINMLQLSSLTFSPKD